MKEQVQKTGVRKWAGQDLVDLQREPLAAITAFFEEYGSCVIKGCDVIPTGSTNTVTPGMVALEGTDQNGQPTFKVAPFAGVEGVTLPIYLTLTYSIVERPYADLKVKPIAYDFRAAVTGVKPTDRPYLEIGVAGGKSFVDAIQDAKHRFFTDTERNKLTGIEAGANNYVHPVKHPASMIEQDDQNRMVTTSKMGEWDAKATTAYVAQQIAALVASSPAALDTLNELAAALGNDPNFATTVTNALAGKAPISSLDSKLNVTFIGKSNIDSDHGQGVFEYDPIPYGTPPIATCANYRTIDIGKFGRRSQLAFPFDEDRVFYRKNHDGVWSSWREFFHTGNFTPTNYVHPDKHPASMIEQDDQNRMVTTAKMGEWDAKATTDFVKQKIAELVASSPAALDTLNELAAALGNDPNFATTVMNALAGKANFQVLGSSNIDSDHGQGLFEYDPIPDGVPPIFSQNIKTIDIGRFDRRTQLAFPYDSDRMYFRRHLDYAGWTAWRELFHSGNFDPSAKADVNHAHNDLGGGYVSGGLEKPDWFNAGKLRLQMLSGANIGTPDDWNDVLWMSSYTGGDVKGSNALILSKRSDRVGFARQDFDSKNWGVYREIFHTGNFALLAARLERCFPSGAFSDDGSKKEHFLDVICAGSVTQTGELKDYWGSNNVSGYPFTVMKISTGVYRIKHESSLIYYGVVVTCRDVNSTDEKDNYATALNRTSSYFEVNTFNSSGSRQDSAFDFIMYRLR